MYVCAYIYIRRYRQLDRYIAFVMSFLMMVRPGVQILAGLLPVVRSHIIDHVHIMWTFAQLGLCPFVLKPGLKLYQKQEHQRGQLGQTFRIMVIGLGVGVEQQNAAPQKQVDLALFLRTKRLNFSQNGSLHTVLKSHFACTHRTCKIALDAKPKAPQL